MITPTAPGAELAARQEVVNLVNRQPALWPLLNELTLRAHRNEISGGADWCDTLRLLLREARRRHSYLKVMT